ncbi:MAG: protein-disulfide reductase DsbD family protein [Capsulimonadaceae bacterium]|nr:protein-disulfide reductase DsbD family protein [Capsulimonadaceae bacterium]
MKNGFLAALALLISMTAAFAALPARAASVAIVSAAVSPATALAGGKGVLTVTFTIASGYHVNANKPGDPYLIGTEFVPAAAIGVTFGKAVYPPVKTLKVSASPKPLLVYAGKNTVKVPFTLAKTVKPGPLALGGSFNYQACNATSCNPPASAKVSASVIVK